MSKNKIKQLIKPLKSRGGRSRSTGRITVWHKGGGHKKNYRVIDFKKNKLGIPARVEAIEYDPNRNCDIALLIYADGEKRYILAPEGLAIDQKVESNEKTPLEIGNCLKLKYIPVGMFAHGVELNVGQGGKLVRGAGTAAQIMANEGGFVHLKFPSGEIRMVDENCRATIGRLSRSEFKDRNLGKAGRNRWLGVRPTVRGSAMSAHDHPHGGGEGRAPIGLRRGPKTPWGKQARGVKTRSRKKPSSKFIVARRKKNK